MNETERDLSILKHIVDYCEQIESTVDHFGDDFEIFDAERTALLSSFASLMFVSAK